MSLARGILFINKCCLYKASVKITGMLQFFYTMSMSLQYKNYPLCMIRMWQVTRLFQWTLAMKYLGWRALGMHGWYFKLSFYFETNHSLLVFSCHHKLFPSNGTLDICRFCSYISSSSTSVYLMTFRWFNNSQDFQGKTRTLQIPQ